MRGPHHFAAGEDVDRAAGDCSSVTTEMTACSSMSALARLVTGAVSDGLNVKLVVNAR
jgi:hypothetical protein